MSILPSRPVARVAAVVVAVAGLVAAVPAGAAAPRPNGETGSGRAFKWIDEKGVTHYGDRVPPEYAKAGRAELNSQGVEVARIPAQLSPEEAARDEARRDEAARSAQHDAFLLATYTSPRDIEQLRDERLALIDGQITATRASLDSTRARIEALVVRAQQFRPYASHGNARRMPDELAEELVRVVRERDSQQVVLQSKQDERLGVRARFEADLNRYEVLSAERRGRR